MGIMANGALLCSSVIGNDNLALLQRPSGHSFMAERAQLSRVGRHDHLQIFRMIRTGRRRHIPSLSISPSRRTVADFTFYDLADINAVVDAVGPFCDLLRMARGAISRAFVFRFLAGDLDDRFSPVVAIFIKRIGSEKPLAPYATTPKATIAAGVERYVAAWRSRFFAFQSASFSIGSPCIVLSSGKASANKFMTSFLIERP